MAATFTYEDAVDTNSGEGLVSAPGAAVSLATQSARDAKGALIRAAYDNDPAYNTGSGNEASLALQTQLAAAADAATQAKRNPAKDPEVLRLTKLLNSVAPKKEFSYEDGVFSYEDAVAKPKAAAPPMDREALKKEILTTSQDALPEVGARVASGLVAAPIGNLAGLGAMAAHYFGLTDKLPEDVKQQVQQALTYQIRGAAGKEMMKPIEWVGEKLEGLAQKGADIIAPVDKSGPLNPLNAGTKEAILQGVNLLGLKGGAAAEAGVAAKQGALDIAKGANAVKDATRDAAIAANYIPPAEGGIQSAISGLNKTKNEKKLSALNEENATTRLKADVGTAPDRALSTAEFDNLKADAGKAYEAVKEAAGPTLTVTPEFKDSLLQTLRAANAKLAYDSKTYEGMKPARDLVQSYLRKVSPPPEAPVMKDVPSVMKTIAEAAQQQPGPAISRTLEAVAADTPYHFGLPPAEAIPVPTPSAATLPTRQTMKAIQDLRSYAKDDFRLGNKDMGTARLGIATQLENMVEANLARSGQAGLLDQFKAARERFAKIYLLERVTDSSTGMVNLQKLGSLSDTPAYKGVMTGEFKTAADFANAYGKVAQKGAGAGISSSLSPFDLMFAVGSLMHGSPKAAIAEVGGRLAVPMLAERGLLKNRTPSYQIGAARTIAPIALQAASIAATQQPRNTRELLLKLLRR